VTVEPLTSAESELLGALVEADRPLSALHGPPDRVEPALSSLLRRGLIELRDGREPVDPNDGLRILRTPRREREPGLIARATEAGRSAWRALGIAADRTFAELEREVRHLRGF
jgi:hypothetical protein